MFTVGLAVILLSAAPAYAQTNGVPVAEHGQFDVQAWPQPVEAAATAEVPVSIRRSIASHGERAAGLLQRQPPDAVNATQIKKPRSGWSTFAGGAVGAVAGFFAGGYLGAAIEGDRCSCDDPGLKGALIGAPIGAVAGGIAGALFLF